MKQRVLVTGANGHLGFNLTKELISEGYEVRAGIRNMKNRDYFNNLSCEVIHADLLDKKSLKKAMTGIDILFQVGAVFKHWAREPQKEIIDPNNDGTRNILHAAHEAGVKRVVYVSSIAALDKNNPGPDGFVTNDTWNTAVYGNPYYQSKRDSEKLAWELAKELSLDMVTVLPSAMIGGEYMNPSYTLNLFKNIIEGKFAFDMEFELNVIDVVDVAKGMIAAARRGINGKRYIMANKDSVSIPRLIEVGRKYNPALKMPKKTSKGVILFIAGLLEFFSKFTGKQPLLQRSTVNLYYGAREKFDLTDSIRDLGFSMEPGLKIVENTFAGFC